MVLSFALAMLISIPPSITASQATTKKTIDALASTAKAINSTVNAVATLIVCHLPAVSVPDSGPNNQTTIEQPVMNVIGYANLTAVPHVVMVIPELDKIEYDDNFSYDVCGVPLDNASLLSTYPVILPSNITSGRNLQVGDNDMVVLQERVAAYFGVRVGGSVDILNQTFHVIGVEGYTPANETAAYISLGNAQTITNETGNATSFDVFVDNVDNVQLAANKISSMYPKLSVSFAASLVDSVIQMQIQINEQLQMAQSIMSQIKSTGTMEIVIVTLVDAGIVFFIMLSSVRERTREIGTLKALGASSVAIIGQFMIEGILLSLIAGFVSMVVGTVGAVSLANLLLPHPTQAGNSTVSTSGVSIGSASSASISVSLTPQLFLLGLAIAVLLGVVGSIYPAWRAARTRPAEAMRYD
jgi:putative ABC transport system permease protein